MNEITNNPTPDERINWCKPNEKFVKGVWDAVNHQLKPTFETVNHPSHYNDGEIEVIDYIEDKKLNFHLGNVIKYVSRAGKKHPDKELEDLKKAKWYLDRYIERLEKKNEE